MKKILLRTLLALLAIIIFLSLPLLFKNKSHIGLKGPDLSELSYTEVSFENKAENLQLSGMLFIPEGDGPFPTAVIINGSGPSYRNGKWYLRTVKYLQNNGIAVLLPDKRGCQKSEGKWRGASIEDLATDVVSSVEFLMNQEIYQSSKIGLIGMSQGGWVAPVAVNSSKDIDFMLSFSGATVTTEEQLFYEEVNNMTAFTYKFIAKLIAPTTVSRIQKMEFYKGLVGFDPIPYLTKINIPVFYGFGGNDQNVPVEMSIQRLKDNGLDTRFKIKTYKNGGHAIRDFDDQSILSPEYLSDMVQFINSEVQ